MKGVLGRYFDVVYVVSLAQRSDRRERLSEEMQRLGLADPSEVDWVRAVSGEQCWAPGFFAAGPGAWGCLQSHLGILQNAIMDERERILVLEDDATFHPRAETMLELFFKQVPSDWEQVFLGGEHFEPPVPIKHRASVYKARRVHRTHAFAMRKKVLPQVYQHIANYPDYMAGGEWHVDHQLGAAHHKGLWKTYTPSWWIVGQKGGQSNIAEKKNPDLWWHPEHFSQRLPFVFAPPDFSPSEVSELDCLHFGNNLIHPTLQDTGLEKCVRDDVELDLWLHLIAKEALSMGRLPAFQHPGIPKDRVASRWKPGVVDLPSAGLSQLAEYPFNGLFKHPLNRKKKRAAAESSFG